jgi:hypothetical protein
MRAIAAVLLLTLACVGVFAVKSVIYPDSWQLTSGRGAYGCTIYRGWSAKQVAEACGPPDASGEQPKIADGEGAPFCSAPCDRWGREMVLYDCQGRVYDAGPAPKPCLGSGSSPRQPLAVPKQ